MITMMNRISDIRLRLFFQPELDLTWKRIVALSGVPRGLAHGERLLSVDDTMRHLLQYGLQDELEWWAIRQACAYASRWKIPVGVKVRAASLRKPDFAARVLSLAEESAMPRGLLEIEINEGPWCQGDRTIDQQLDKLCTGDVGIVLDKFGSFVTGLSHFGSSSFRRIKVDAEVVSQSCGPNAPGIARGIVALARAITSEVAVTRIETIAQWDLWATAGCDSLQGPLVCRSLDGPTVDVYLRTQSRHPGMALSAAAG